MSENNYRVEFTGHSDDIISVKTVRHVSYCDAQGDSVHEDEDEIGAYGAHEKPTRIKVSNLGGSRVCIVNAFYDGTWSFAPAMLEEERKLPPWQFVIDQPDHPYSVRLTITAEDDELTYERLKDE